MKKSVPVALLCSQLGGDLFLLHGFDSIFSSRFGGLAIVVGVSHTFVHLHPTALVILRAFAHSLGGSSAHAASRHCTAGSRPSRGLAADATGRWPSQFNGRSSAAGSPCSLARFLCWGLGRGFTTPLTWGTAPTSPASSTRATLCAGACCVASRGRWVVLWLHLSDT